MSPAGAAAQVTEGKLHGMSKMRTNTCIILNKKILKALFIQKEEMKT